MATTTSDPEQVRQTITKYLSSHFSVNFGEVTEQMDLFQEGLIDSFGFVELVAFLEKTFAIRFEEKEFTTNSLNTVANMVATVTRKTAA
jgi:D-alanine--poly(phosphoribitol) ligase subunit 2